MNNNLLLGIGHTLVPVPPALWHQHVASNAQNMAASLGFMSVEHHLVRNFVVRELPRVGKPLAPEYIAQSLNLPLARVYVILDDLQANMTFLFRNDQGEVAWAYPVTVDKTPHEVALSSGERVYAA